LLLRVWLLGLKLTEVFWLMTMNTCTAGASREFSYVRTLNAPNDIVLSTIYYISRSITVLKPFSPDSNLRL
jgi:hypothetical protein